MKTFFTLVLILGTSGILWSGDRVLSPYEQLIELEKKAASGQDLDTNDLESLNRILEDPRVTDTPGLETRIKALMWTAAARTASRIPPEVTSNPPLTLQPEKQSQELWLGLALGSAGLGLGLHFGGLMAGEMSPDLQTMAKYGSWSAAALSVTFSLIFAILNNQ